MEPIPRELVNFCYTDGRDPFGDWIIGLRDTKARGIIRTRINRVGAGIFGDCAGVGEGVQELRIDFGPGYRVYFGVDGNQIVLLGGGDKSTQQTDIEKCKQRWREHNA